MADKDANSNPNTDPSTNKSTVMVDNPEEMQRIFNQFDANGDGKISLGELGSIMKAMGSSCTEKELQRAMEDLDTDKDGHISLQEFATLCRSSSSDESELREAFDLYDQDRNGLISSAELHLILNRLNMKCSMEECVKMIKSVDSDGDGNVNFEEFQKMMEKSVN